jgi:hypothetical protein
MLIVRVTSQFAGEQVSLPGEQVSLSGQQVSLSKVGVGEHVRLGAKSTDESNAVNKKGEY